jgi:hypothetical protein
VGASRDAEVEEKLAERSDPWSDLALTLPLFLAYHLGVVFLPVQNAADVVTRELVALAENNLMAYGGLTLGLGVVFVTVLSVLGRGHELRWQRFVLILCEATVYAVAMRLAAGYLVGSLRLAGAAETGGTFGAVVLSLGAGFYEEIAFRVLLFGLGARVLRLFAEPISPARGRLLTFGWALFAAALFSGWHHLGPFGEPFDLRPFVFRWVCGLVFTLIYAFRGFAPVVWTHTVYDVWVLTG